MDPQVRFLPSGRTLRVAPGTNLLEAARAAGLPIAQACSGEGLCARCVVRVLRGGRGVSTETARESEAKRRNRVAPELRLACQVVPSADVDVTASYW
ncbi:MAG TPA: 2Fe-2S iron-sulfur cluster-binding protein [Myxococcota bacterium]|nr:2Fe-2S iron-sulfur cluster-binding protein [Myxococcota bacterium]